VVSLARNATALDVILMATVLWEGAMRAAATGYVEAPNNSSSSERRDPGQYPDPRLRTGGQPDNSSPPEAMRRYLQGRRDEAYRNYTNGLSNAWKADPGRADVVERQAEKWRHGK
jgi:hypothetical protein